MNKRKITLQNNLKQNIESWYFISGNKTINEIKSEIKPYLWNVLSSSEIDDLVDSFPKIIRLFYAFIKSNEMYNNRPSLVDIASSKNIRDIINKSLNSGLVKERDRMIEEYKSILNIPKKSKKKPPRK